MFETTHEKHPEAQTDLHQVLVLSRNAHTVLWEKRSDFLNTTPRTFIHRFIIEILMVVISKTNAMVKLNCKQENK